MCIIYGQKIAACGLFSNEIYILHPAVGSDQAARLKTQQEMFTTLRKQKHPSKWETVLKMCPVSLLHNLCWIGWWIYIDYASPYSDEHTIVQHYVYFIREPVL